MVMKMNIGVRAAVFSCLLMAGIPCSFAQKPALTAWNYVPSYGQSLSVGWTAKPVVTVEQKDGNLMFKGGVRPFEGGNDRSAVVPLVETISPDGPGERRPFPARPGISCAC